MNEPTVAYIIMIMIGTAIGYLWGHYIGSKSDYSLEWDTKNKIAQLEAVNERLRELMSDASLDDWFCQDNEEWMAEWRKAIGGEQ